MGRQTIWGGAGRPPSREVMQAAAKAARQEMMQRIRDNKAGQGERSGGGGGNGGGQRRGGGAGQGAPAGRATAAAKASAARAAAGVAKARRVDRKLRRARRTMRRTTWCRRICRMTSVNRVTMATATARRRPTRWPICALKQSAAAKASPIRCAPASTS